MADRLYRSRDDRVVAGVAGGLAEMWDADPSLIRIIWALLIVFTGGIALVVYIVMAIVVPEEDAIYPVATPPSPGASDSDAAMALTDPAQAARDAHAEARAARRAARAEGGGMSAGLLFGGVLVVLGLFFLVRQFLPQFDFDWFWPLVLVGLGIVLVVSAIGRGPRSGTPR